MIKKTRVFLQESESINCRRRLKLLITQFHSFCPSRYPNRLTSAQASAINCIVSNMQQKSSWPIVSTSNSFAHLTSCSSFRSLCESVQHIEHSKAVLEHYWCQSRLLFKAFPLVTALCRFIPLCFNGSANGNTAVGINISVCVHLFTQSVYCFFII